MKETTANMKSFIISSFENDSELRNVMFEYFLDEINIDDSLGIFLYEIADILYTSTSNKFFNKGISAVEFYELEYSKYLKNITYDKESVFYNIKQSIKKNFSDKEYDWRSQENKKLYIQILSSYLHSNIKNFFYENRKRFLPEYDWFIIEKEERRKFHIEAFFKEFDKFSTVIDSISNYVNLDKIPKDYLSYMSSILGIKMITEQGITSHDQIRSVLGNMVSVYKEKGSLGSLELFLGSLGIGINLSELFFDRRMYWYLNDDENFRKNPYTNVLSDQRYQYYLTPNNPMTTFYPLAPNEIVSSLGTPVSESFFKKTVDENRNETGYVNMEEVLNYTEKKIETNFTYFKTNTIIIKFHFFQSESSLISLKYQNLLEDYMTAIIPIYVRKYYPTILFEETNFEDELSFALYGASEYTSLQNELFSVENMDNYIFKNISIKPNEDSELGELGEYVEDNDEVIFDYENADKTVLIGEEEIEEFSKFKSNQTSFVNEELAIEFILPEEKSNESEFSVKDANLTSHYGFTFNPNLDVDSLSDVNLGNIGINYYEYGNDIKSIYMFNVEDTEHLDIEIT